MRARLRALKKQERIDLPDAVVVLQRRAPAQQAIG
jgi:uncharacterized membrane protein